MKPNDHVRIGLVYQTLETKNIYQRVKAGRPLQEKGLRAPKGVKIFKFTIPSRWDNSNLWLKTPSDSAWNRLKWIRYVYSVSFFGFSTYCIQHSWYFLVSVFYYLPTPLPFCFLYFRSVLVWVVTLNRFIYTYSTSQSNKSTYFLV